MKRLLLLVLLLFVIGCTTRDAVTVDYVKENTSAVEPAQPEENTNLQVSQEIPQMQHSIAELQAELSHDYFKTALLNESYKMVEDGDTLYYIGAERDIVIQKLSRPMQTWDDFYGRMIHWDLGAFYIDDEQFREYHKSHKKLTPAQVDELFDSYIYSTYAKETTFIDEYTKKELVGSAVRLRFETMMPRNGYNRWALPVAVYAIPCGQDVIVYLRNDIDRAEYSGTLETAKKNREAFVSNTQRSMMERIQGLIDYCGVPQSANAAFTTQEATVERGFNDKAFYRTIWDYSLQIKNVVITPETISYAVNFSNSDLERLSNRNFIELEMITYTIEGDEIRGDELVVVASQGGDRNNFLVPNKKSHNWNIESDIDTVKLVVKPELKKIIDIDEDSEREIFYELAPIELVVQVSR